MFVSECVERRFSLNDFGYMVFHSPYCKLVQKSLARLLLNDFLAHPNPNMESGPFSGLEAFRSVSINEENCSETELSFLFVSFCVQVKNPLLWAACYDFTAMKTRCILTVYARTTAFII